jgi:hypothetical protein
VADIVIALVPLLVAALVPVLIWGGCLLYLALTEK